jgi:arginase family enzyme
MHIDVTIFPFDLFGSGGAGAGARLLGDAVHEILDDLEAETAPCRADCLRGKVAVHECDFQTLPQLEKWRKTGREAFRAARKTGRFQVWLGGNHLSVLPVLEELGKDTLLIQLDAHLDIYSFHDNTSELTHGNFLKHFEKKSQRPRIINVGHRDLFLTAPEIATTFEAVYSAEQIARDPGAVADELRALALGARRVWIDIDADVFDPAFMPAIHQPLPFGLDSLTVLKLLNAVWSDNVAGLSISEFDPGRDVRDQGLELLGWLLEHFLLEAGSLGQE